MTQGELKKRLKAESNFTTYETVQHNKYIVCMKLIISVSKHLSGEKKGDWICPPTWKLDFTRPLIRIDYTSPAQSRQAALRVPEPILTAKIFKKI